MPDQSDDPPTAEFVMMDYASPSRPLPKGKAVAAMLFGIVAFISPIVFIGIPIGVLLISLPCAVTATVLGKKANRDAREGRAGGRGMAIAGRAMGLIVLLLGILNYVLYLFLVPGR